MEEYYDWEPIGYGGKRVGNIEVWPYDGKYLLRAGKDEWLVDNVKLYHSEGRVVAKFGDETLEYYI